VVRILLVLLASFAVAACQPPKSRQQKIEPKLEESGAEIITKKRINELANVPALDGPSIPIAVYKFNDMTGQRKPAQSFASLSSAVTQGAEVFLIKALQDAGNGNWFKVVERVGLENLVKERQIIRSQRELYEKEEAKPLTPLIVAGVMIEGGIVGYDSNIGTGGVGARVLGIGASQEYRKDEVTVVLRLVSVNTGEVLLSTGASKTILSTSAGANLFKFVDLGTKSVEFEAGATVNEPTTYAVRVATETAVADMIREGAKKKLWKFKTKGK
jgi:curli production assembly/transport component CsgG